MLFAGSNDGVYSLNDIKDSGKTTVEQALDTSAVRRLLQLDGFDGLFAATASGLYHSPDGDKWSDLGIPRENVYAVAGRAGRILYAGTRPAHIYTARVDNRGLHDEREWEELDEFQEQPSRDEWRLPRHEDLAQVRDVHVPADVSNRIVAGVEVGGVHVSNDRGSS